MKQIEITMLGAALFSLTTFSGVGALPNQSAIGEFRFGAVTEPFHSATGNGITVKVGYQNRVQVSTDGIKWRIRALPIPYSLRDVAFGNGQFIAVGNEGVILSSVNGLKWTAQNSRTEERLRGIIFSQEKFVIVGYSGTILISRDGKGWKI
jgi:hypothetical protein